MKRFYHIIRFIAVAIIILAAVLPAIIYVGLSLPSVQSRITSQTEKELSALIDSHVTIGSINISPFNRVTLRGIVVEPTPGDTALRVDRLGAGIDLWDLAIHRHITINYVELIGMDARIWRDSAASPLNIEPIIKALQPKEKKKTPARFNLRINTLLIRSSNASYDVRSTPATDRFNPDHARISNLRADIRLPKIANNDFAVEIKRLALDAVPGFTLSNLQGNFHVADEELAVNGLAIDLPNSALEFEDMRLPLKGLGSIPEALRNAPLRVSMKPGSSLYCYLPG